MKREFLEMLGRSVTREEPSDRPLSDEEAEGVRFALRERERRTQELWGLFEGAASEIEEALGETRGLWHGSPEPTDWSAEIRAVFAYGPRTATIRIAGAPTELPLQRALLGGIFARGAITLGTADKLAGALPLHLIAGQDGQARWATLQGESYTLLGEGQIERLFGWLLLEEAAGV